MLLTQESLQRFYGDRTRWTDSGEKEIRTAIQDGIEPDIVHLFRDRATFENALRPLLNATFLQRQQTGSNTSIQIQPLVQQFVIRELTEEERLRWLMVVIRLISHAVPEEACLEDKNFEIHWSVIINHVFKCLEALHITRASPAALADVHKPLVFMLLCSVGRSDKNRGLLSYADSLIRYRSDIWQRCLATKWRAYFEFNGGDKVGAERLLAAVQEQVASRMNANPSLKTPRNNAAMGDLVLHRAQCLFWQRNYPLAARIVQSWSPTTASRLETRIHRQLRAAMCKNLVYLGEYDRATADLESMLACTDPQGPLEELDEFNWATVTLGELYCKQKQYSNAFKLIEPRVERCLAENRRLDFISSDFRVILCEVLLQMGKYDAFDSKLRALEADLLHPGQKGKPRAQPLLAEVRRLRARSFYLRERWPQALDAWRRLLLSEGVTENAILEDGFAAQHSAKYCIAEAIVSLAVTYWRAGDEDRSKIYWNIVNSQPASLVHPAESIDYTGWLDLMTSEYTWMSKATKRRGKWLRRRRRDGVKPGEAPESEMVVSDPAEMATDREQVSSSRGSEFDFLERDFTTELSKVGTYASCPDCEHCHCDLRP